MADLVQITIPKPDLGQFIIDLLGQNRRIEKSIDGPFEIDIEFLQNLDSIIEQRIKGQQDAQLVDFSTKI